MSNGLQETEYSSNNFDNMNDSQKQTIENIKELQEMEKSLYKKLDTSVSGNLVSKTEAKQIVNRINELSTLRQNLYKNLKNMYSLLRTNVASSRQNLVNDLTNVGIVESELNNAKNQIQVLQTEKNNKLRMVEINKYYSLNYKNHSNIMKIIILTCIPIIIFAFIGNKEIIPSWITNILISLSLGIGIIFMFFSVKDLYFRDNMNYEKYDFGSNPPPSNAADKEENPFIEVKDKSWDDSFGCFGKECCAEGTAFNSDTNRCESVNETMISGDLTKHVFNDNAHETIVLPNKNVVNAFSENNSYAKV